MYKRGCYFLASGFSKRPVRFKELTADPSLYGGGDVEDGASVYVPYIPLDEGEGLL